MFPKIRILPQNSQLCRNAFLEIRSKVKNHYISEAGVSFEIQFICGSRYGLENTFLHMAANYRLN